MPIMPMSELKIGHIYHLRAADDINVGIWNGKSFICPAEDDEIVMINHYDESYPLGVAQPISQISELPVDINGVNKNVVRTLSAANTLFKQITAKHAVDEHEPLGGAE